MSKPVWMALAVIAAIAVLAFLFRTRLPGAARIRSAEADAQTLRALQEAGADLTKETEVNFYLYFPVRDSAARAAGADHAPGLAATVRPGADGKTWLCLISGRMVPSEADIRDASLRMQALASSLGGEYDGWEAAVTK
jgi:Regulator of ribonuclease activity B